MTSWLTVLLSLEAALCSAILAEAAHDCQEEQIPAVNAAPGVRMASSGRYRLLTLVKGGLTEDGIVVLLGWRKEVWSAFFTAHPLDGVATVLRPRVEGD